ncbi:MAG: transporter [Pseudomonadota bacterium]
MLTIKRTVFSIFVLSLSAQTVFADSGYSLGAEYSEGDYGTGETVSSLYVPFGWHYSGGDFSASVIVPYLYVEGSSQLTFDGRPLAPSGMGGGGGGSTTTTRTDSGLGDIVMSGSYQLLSESGSRPWLAATAKVKFGTADEIKGLGTGENDYTIQVEAAKGVLYGYVGYKLLGDAATVDYNDVSFVGAALTLPLGEKLDLGVEYYTEEASLVAMDDIQEATLSVGGELSGGVGYSLYYVSGLSDSSADSVIGINFRTALK